MGIFWPAPGPSNAEFASLQDGLAIVADGNTHIAITSGQYVYVKNHDTLSDGLYKASSNIAANATLSSSNLTADSKGGLNDIAEQIAWKVLSDDTAIPATAREVIALVAWVNSLSYCWSFALIPDESRYYQQGIDANNNCTIGFDVMTRKITKINVTYQGTNVTATAPMKIYYR